LKAIAVSRRGESHRADGRECQDFCHAEARGSFAMAVVCDGHGGRRYFRSRAGAEAAAEVTGECVSELIENADPGLFINEPVTGREALTTERGKKDFRKWDERDELMHRLFAAIAVRWRERIARSIRSLKRSGRRSPGSTLRPLRRGTAAGSARVFLRPTAARSSAS